MREGWNQFGMVKMGAWGWVEGVGRREVDCGGGVVVVRLEKPESSCWWWL